MGTGWQCKGVWAEFQVAAVGNSEGGISSNDLGVREGFKDMGLKQVDSREPDLQGWERSAEAGVVSPRPRPLSNWTLSPRRRV